MAVVAAFLASCSMQTQPTPPAAVVDKVYGVSCDDAFRIAAKTLKVRGLRVVAVNRSPAGGTVIGKGEKEEIEVGLSCSGTGVTVGATGGLWQEQGVRMSFANFVEQGDRIWPPPRGPKILLEQLRGAEAKIEFPTELEPLGMSAIRMRAVNGGSRPVSIEPRRIAGTTATGTKAGALSAEGVQQKLGSSVPDLDRRILRATTLKQGEEVRGFVFLPAGEYVSVLVKVVDEETGEPDEFEIFLKD